MIVSFLIPTRQRLQMLLDVIRSIRESASQDTEVEILVRVDEDDHETLAARDRIQGKLVVGPRGHGYNNIDIYVNEMAVQSHGDWIIGWNDDAYMRSIYWDKLLPSPDTVKIFWLRAPWMVPFAFPIISRKLYELWGCCAPGMPTDTTILWVCQAAGVPTPTQSQDSNILLVEHRRDEVNTRMIGASLKEKINFPDTYNVYKNKKSIAELAKLLSDAYQKEVG